MKKVVLITGASSGIGYFTALTFARSDYKVYASMRNLSSDGSFSLKKIAKEESLKINILKLDVTNENSIKKAIATILKSEKNIDILVNNAGTLHLGPVEEFTIDEIKVQFETNFFGAFRISRYVIPVMRKNRSGKIINISSINGLIPFPLYGIYSASKFALETISEVMKFELEPFGIKVSVLEPGVFDTNFWRKHRRPSVLNRKKSEYIPLLNFLDKLAEKQRYKKASFIQNHIHPQKVADRILQTAQEKNPRLRQIIGLDAKFLYLLKKLLPDKAWFYLLHKIYRW